MTKDIGTMIRELAEAAERLADCVTAHAATQLDCAAARTRETKALNAVNEAQKAYEIADAAMRNFGAESNTSDWAAQKHMKKGVAT